MGRALLHTVFVGALIVAAEQAGVRTRIVEYATEVMQKGVSKEWVFR